MANAIEKGKKKRKKNMVSAWVEAKADVDFTDENGRALHLTGVRALRNTKTGKALYDPASLARAEMTALAEHYDVSERDLPIFLVLRAPAGYFKTGVVLQKYRLNKMLFYNFKRLEPYGLSEAMPHDEMCVGRAGPIPRHLTADLKDLEGRGLLDINWGTHRPGSSIEIRLTTAGQQLADNIWNDVPNAYRTVAVKVKEELSPMSAKDIKEKVHEEFPEYRKIYVVEDRE